MREGQICVKEKAFVESLISNIKGADPLSVIIKASDKFTLGIPDVLAWMSGGKTIALEAKQLHPTMDDPFHRGRRTGQMLKHPFSGPQISMLRKMSGVDVFAFGIVRASSDTAFLFRPEDLCTSTGNFTHEDMVKLGVPVLRKNGTWELPFL